MSAINRKLEMDFISKLEKRQSHDDLLRRRLHSQRTLQNAGGSSSSADDSSFVEHADGVDDDGHGDDDHEHGHHADDDAEDESEMIQMLLQCEQRMEHTRALRVRSHLLRPEDYVSAMMLGSVGCSGLCGCFALLFCMKWPAERSTTSAAAFVLFACLFATAAYNYW